MSKRNWKVSLTTLMFLAACGVSDPPNDVGDISGVQEIGQPIAALATPPAFATGTLTVTLAAGGETAIISKHAVSGAILVNDVATTGATATTVKNIAVTGGAGNDTVILDFANGTFAPGVTGGPGITVALAAGTDAFKIRGASSAADTITVGGTALATDIAFNIDAFKDIAVTGTGTVAYTFSLGGGADVFNALSGAYGTGGAAYAGPLTVYGGTGDDTLTGGNGNDTMYGDLGNDTLSGGTSITDADVYSGGGGADTVTYAARGALAPVTVTVGAGANDGDNGGGETDNTGADVEIVRGGSGDDTFTGWTGNETFYGGAGNDTFLMGLFASTGAGADTVYGEAGTDTVSYAARIEGIVVTMDLKKSDDGATGETDNISDDVENLICPTAAVTCVVTGNALDNKLTGGGGDDTFVGGAGDDTFVMGANGTIGAGTDQLSGGAGVDTVDFSNFGAVIDVVMDFTASTTMGKKINTDVENLICPSANICTATGNAANNHVWGSSAADVITLGGGDDFYESGGGNDTVDCGDGSDIVTGAGTLTKTACEL